ncbi:hypothetical protein ABT404_38455 [Streptomyces hyaluromycini]|uniref:Uncharacterized protein n=1 Tax=Streptomyces hyaluromycini TaxID=1377993 RepID=A0ABV1X8D8_9ACTN
MRRRSEQRHDRGICEAGRRQTRLKEPMSRRAEHVHVLAHGAKPGRASFRAFEACGARVEIVPPAGE